MLPVAAAQGWKIPAITSVGALCEWLRVMPEETKWFADLKARWNRKSGAGSFWGTIRIGWLPKRSGDFRLIEAPKTRS